MKSIEELARELVEDISNFDNDITIGEVRDWQCFLDLKSALDTPPALPPAEEWPQWYRCPQGDLYKRDAIDENCARWSAAFQQWGTMGKAYALDDLKTEFGIVPIPAAEALAIIEKSTKRPN